MNNETELTSMQYAMQVHQNIIINGGIAANALCEMCRNLKIMRDEKLYETLGYSDFDTYSIKMANIKARQAYTYISAFESLGEANLQLTANMGITKLSLIAQLPPADRADAIENRDEIAGMTVAQVKDLVIKAKQQGEQLALFETAAKEKDGTIEYLNEKLKETENELTGQTLEAKIIPDEQDTEKIIKAAKAEAEAEYKSTLEKLKEKYKKDIVYAGSVAETKGKVAGSNEAENKLKAEYEEKIKQLETAANEAKARAEALEKQVMLSNNDIMTLKIYLQGVQESFKKCVSFLQSRQMDKETYLKCASAINKMVEILMSEAKGL